MNNKGWVKCYREQFNNWISKKPFCDGYAWTYLYSRANYKKGMINFRNEYIEVKRGQFLTSKLKLKDTFGWTYRHVENLLKALENDEMITYRTTNRYIVITIINYDLYQSNDDESDKQNGEQMINRLGTDDKQITNEATQIRSIKKEKKEKKVKKKDKYLDCVYLTKDEYNKLVEKFNKDVTDNKIEDLNNYIMSKGKRYKSHYYTILNWGKKDMQTTKAKSYGKFSPEDFK
jgi:hypothetical protein